MTNLIKMFKNALYFSVLFCGLIFTGCSNQPSLQQYIVDHQEAPNFISVDIPMSIFDIDQSSLSDKQAEALQSIKQLNVLGYSLQNTNSVDFETEYTTVKTILEQEQYIDLVEFKDAQLNLVVKYLGNDTAANELIVFGGSNQYGFAVARLLGKDMKPENVVSLFQALKKGDFDNADQKLSQIISFFK